MEPSLERLERLLVGLREMLLESPPPRAARRLVRGLAELEMAAGEWRIVAARASTKRVVNRPAPTAGGIPVARTEPEAKPTEAQKQRRLTIEDET